MKKFKMNDCDEDIEKCLKCKEEECVGKMLSELEILSTMMCTIMDTALTKFKEMYKGNLTKSESDKLTAVAEFLDECGLEICSMQEDAMKTVKQETDELKRKDLN